MVLNHRLYVGTIGEGLYCSTDEGETFERSKGGIFVECHVRALAIHPQDPRRLFLGTEQGLFRSDDGAENWGRVESPLNGLQIWSILILPHDPNVMFVGTCPSRIFRSEDGGQSWHERSVEILKECPLIMNTRVTTLFADPTRPETVWAGVEIDALFRSDDAGISWQPMGDGLSSRDIHAMAIVPGNGKASRLLVATNDDLNVSTDNGVSWKPLEVGSSLPWSYCRALAQPIGSPETLLLGNGDGPPGSVGLVARSIDSGQTWSATEMPHRANSTIWNFAVNAAEPKLIYASSCSGEIYQSLDCGASWRQLPREFGEIRALAWTE